MYALRYDAIIHLVSLARDCQHVFDSKRFSNNVFRSGNREKYSQIDRDLEIMYSQSKLQHAVIENRVNKTCISADEKFEKGILAAETLLQNVEDAILQRRKTIFELILRFLES